MFHFLNQKARIIIKKMLLYWLVYASNHFEKSIFSQIKELTVYTMLIHFRKLSQVPYLQNLKLDYHHFNLHLPLLIIFVIRMLLLIAHYFLLYNFERSLNRLNLYIRQLSFPILKLSQYNSLHF